MTGRRHSAPLTSDLQRYGTRAQAPGPGVNRPEQPVGHLSDVQQLLSHGDNLCGKMVLSWTSEDEEVHLHLTAFN